MKAISCVGAVVLAVGSASSALAVWGVRYEVNTGAGWATSASIDVSATPRDVDFRIIVYHDGVTQVTTPLGTMTALTPLRLCNSQKITNFGQGGAGDSLVSFNHTVTVANQKALASAQSGADLILGTPNIALSFAAYSGYAFIIPHPAVLEVQYYRGTIRVGNSTPAAAARTITVTANSFAYPNAGSGTGGAYGASFYASTEYGLNGVPTEPAVVIPAVITVKTPCPADLDGDGIVGDADFSLFCAAHDLVDCADPAMPEGCPADLNGDGSVDDADFVIFVAAYDAVLCG